MSKFQRADGYSEETLGEIRQMLSKCNGHAIVIPSTDSAIFYYRGKPFLSVDSSKGKWKRFGAGYNKYFEDESSGIKGLKSRKLI